MTHKQVHGIDARAQRFVRAMAEGKPARADFDDKMRAAMSDEALAAAWQGVVARAGRLVSLGAMRHEDRDGYRAVIVTTKHEKTSMDVRVVFDASEKIAGLWFKPAAQEWQPPAYVGAFEEQPLSVGELPGTLTLPKGNAPFRAAVLVHGSGPNDRDESLGAAKPFRDLAQGLATRGIAVLRYDKRTRVAPGSLKGSFDLDDEVTHDARAAVALLVARTDIDRKHVVVIGHSLGASMAPRIAQGTPSVAAIALLAGATRPFEKLLVDQYRYLFGVRGVDGATATAQIEAIQAEIRRVRAEGADDELLAVAGAKAPRRYWRDVLDRRGESIAKELSIPMFVAQGGRDYQVTIEDFAGWKSVLAGRANVAFHLYPSLNHAFVSGEGPSTPDEYDVPGHVDAAVVNDLAAWILQLE